MDRTIKNRTEQNDNALTVIKGGISKYILLESILKCYASSVIPSIDIDDDCSVRYLIFGVQCNYFAEKQRADEFLINYSS